MDVTCDVKALSRFRNKHQAEILKVATQVNFDSVEIDSLVNIYVKLMSDRGPTATTITRMQLRSLLYEMLDMPDDYLVDRIMVALDTFTLPTVPISTFIKCMSVFLRGTFDERCRYCYTVYDIVGDEMIKRDQLIYLMKRSILSQQVEDIEESVKDICDLLIKKLDRDLDGSISYKDYAESVAERPELMELFGHCLPDRTVVNAFLKTFTHNIPKF